MGPLPLNALKAFEAAARHLSIKQAAAELFVTPAAVSQSIKTLEDYLGVPLFHRVNRGLLLTEAGEVGLNDLRAGFERVSEGVRKIRAMDDQGHLSIWSAPSFAARWLVPRLQRFARTHPWVSLHLSAADELVGDEAIPVQDLASVLHQRNIHFAIRFGSGNYAGCRVEKLMSVEVVPLCTPEMRDDPDRPLVNAAELAHHTLLHDDTAYNGNPDWATWLNAAGVDHIDGSRGLFFNQVSMALDAALDHQGVALSIPQLAVDDLRAGRLVIPFDLPLKLDYAYYLVSPESKPLRPQDDAFRDWLVDEIARHDEALRAVRRPTIQ